MVCSISQGTSLTPPFNLVFFPQRQAAWVPRHAISATKGLAWGPHDTATTLEKTKKTMGSVRFGWGQYPKKLRESGIWKKKNGADRFFWLESFRTSCSGGSMASGFPLLWGKAFSEAYLPYHYHFAPQNYNRDEKKLYLSFRGSACWIKGPCQLAGFRGGNWYQLTCHGWDPLKWPQQVSLRPEDLGNEWHREKPWLHMCWAEGPSIAIMEV